MSSITYRSYQVPRCGPRSLVMSQEYTWPGAWRGVAARGTRRWHAGSGTWWTGRTGRSRRRADGPTPAPVTCPRRTDRVAVPAPARVRAPSARWPGPAAAGAVPTPPAWAWPASSASIGAGPRACRRGARPRRRVRRKLHPSPARPRLALVLGALGEQFQERVCFSHDLQRSLGPGQVLGELLVLPAQPLHLRLLGRVRAAAPAPRRRRGLLVRSGLGLLGRWAGHQRAGVAGLAPFDDVGVVEPFPAQQSTALARHGPVVLRHHPQLVVGGERAPTRLVCSRAAGGTHNTIIGPHVSGVSVGQGHGNGSSCLALQLAQISRATPCPTRP